MTSATPVEVPSRRALSAAEAANRRRGDENLGFLSESHGFIPMQPPARALPPAFAEWDAVGAQLPELCRSLRLRPRLDAMPVLDAGPGALPDALLLRASVLISNFAHAYYYLEPNPPKALPDPVRLPWEAIARRLHRREAHMSYIDMSTYNWRLRDPDAADPMRVENLEPLVAVWGNEAERIFLGSTIEILAQSTPLVGAMVRAQEAVLRDDVAALRRELEDMGHCLRHLTYVCLPKIVQNPYSEFFVDPVVWAKTIAPLSVPIRKGAAGPVGAATPSLQVLDAFFERGSYRSDIGHESSLVRAWYPLHWRRFYEAMGQVSVPDYVRRRDDPALTRLFRDTLHAYAGDSGFLGRHRLKAYGYIETAFKIGRPATAAFEGSFQDRAWDNVDRQLELARQERYRHFSSGDQSYAARLLALRPVSEGGGIMQVRLDLDAEVAFAPGDRCAILPENTRRLVDKTLRALGAGGDESVALDDAWRAALNQRSGLAGAQVLPLRDLLRYGQLRPLRRPVAKYLQQGLRSAFLADLLQRHAEEEWELWDLLERLAAEGHAPQRLWRDAPDGPWELCRIIPPERFRTYSIASAPRPGEAGRTELELTVGELSYGDGRQGVASAFLASRPEQPFPARIVPAPAFHPPRDRSRPLLLIAGGTGIAPFRAFLQQRAADPQAAGSWLFYGIRETGDFCHAEELLAMQAAGRLHLHLSCSREDRVLKPRADGRAEFVPGPRRRLDDAIRRQARDLRRLLLEPARGGDGAHLYVCGRMDFALSVESALLDVLGSGEDGMSEAEARDYLQRLRAQGRYQRETFTAMAPARDLPLHAISEVARHNRPETGYWSIIEEQVYDLGDFLEAHPGGAKILLAYAGMDATGAYRRVAHHHNPEVMSMLGAYRIGSLRRPRFRDAAWEALYQAWVGYLFLVVEIENAMGNDFGIQREATTHDELEGGLSLSPVKLMMHLRSHERCVGEFLPQLCGPALRELLPRTLEPCGRSPRALLQALDELPAGPAREHTAARFAEWVGELKDGPPDLAAVRARCLDLERQDRLLLGRWKTAVRELLRLLETHRDPDGAAGRQALAGAVERLPRLAADYYRALLEPELEAAC